MKTKKTQKIVITGERLIPEYNKGTDFLYEHLARYLFSSQFVKGKKVIDVGCGVGYGSKILKIYGKAKTVDAIDISRNSIKYAKKHYYSKNIFYNIDNAEKLLTVQNNNMDVAVSFELIEHLKHPRIFLKQIKRVLKKNGLFIFSTPNKYTYPKGNPYHIKEYYPEELKQLLKNYFINVDYYYQVFEFSQLMYKT